MKSNYNIDFEVWHLLHFAEDVSEEFDPETKSYAQTITHYLFSAYCAGALREALATNAILKSI